MSSKKRTTATKDDGKSTLVPKLRFPEFQGADAWKRTTLGEVTIKTDKRNKGGKSYPVYSISNKTGFTPQTEQFEGVDSEKRGYDIALYKLIESKTFAYNPARINVGSIGYSGELNNVIISSLYVCFKTKPEAADQFLQHFFGTSDFEKSVNNHVEGGIRSYLFYENFARIPIPLPPIPEQQKIASCLSSLDELIVLQGRKVDAIKTHKKGLMQQLFPREGETQPRLRFPEFQNAGDWEIEALGQLADYENGKAYEQDIAENGKYIVVNSRFISTDGAVRKYTNAEYLIAKAGEVLMVLSDLPKGRALAKCYFVESDDRYAVNQRVCRLEPRRIHGKFLYYTLNRHPRLLAYDDGLNQTHLSKGGVTECLLCVPPQKDEQQRIASCLSSIDTLITAETEKLEALSTHKKGLMQQLFPSPEES